MAYKIFRGSSRVRKFSSIEKFFDKHIEVVKRLNYKPTDKPFIINGQGNTKVEIQQVDKESGIYQIKIHLNDKTISINKASVSQIMNAISYVSGRCTDVLSGGAKIVDGFIAFANINEGKLYEVIYYLYQPTHN